MKLIEAIIRPFKLDDVREALSEVGVRGFTITEVEGYGRQKGQASLYNGVKHAFDFIPKVKVEVALEDDVVDKALACIEKSAKTGKVGDGKIYVQSLNQVARIRTSEIGEAAL
ncbi:MAG: transcriptional regulator [Proteobacteria bacterium]|nr:transcriptional regulator [Pseudomonadota bacterium]|tara:strand:- start:73 stop:411 length:339 start_codon:yes stop_codon:yes gene_type:complete